jgi:regulatory protein
LAAADLLARRAWTRADLIARLKRRGAPERVAVDVVDDLAARGHVDDRVFAAQWVETRAPRGYGAVRLRRELRLRGVAGSLIDAALASLPAACQLEQARASARRRYPALLRVAPARAAARLRDYLMRRGFTAAVVLRVVRELAPQAIGFE